MTAEIVIINKEAIALAADSAVTASISDGEKIFTTADKIFRLSTNKPVGVMFFNSAQFLGVPWETIINEIRKNIPPNGFNTLKEYVKCFLSFFQNGSYLFSDNEQRRYLGYQTYSNYIVIVKNIKNTINDELKKHGPLSERSIKLIISKVIKNDLEEWRNIKENKKYTSISLDVGKKIVNHYRDVIKKAQELALQNIPLSRQAIKNLFEIAYYCVAWGANDDTNTGIVIAGFGEKEAFPSVSPFIFEGLYFNRLKYFKLKGMVVGQNTEGSVLAFAQREMVSRFMEGVDPDYRDMESYFMSQVAEKYSKAVVKNLKKYNTLEKKRLISEIRKNCHSIFEEYRKTMDKKIQEMFSDPITDVVAVLPKSDLATLAESLVSITSVKRKFSTERETVSEPIDVAVISKTDGFVWIKKKRYYDSR